MLLTSPDTMCLIRLMRRGVYMRRLRNALQLAELHAIPLIHC